MTIDWNKPLRTVTEHYPVNVLYVSEIEKNRLISWPISVDNIGYAFVSNGGKTAVTLNKLKRNGIFEGSTLVENVPEEPRDYMVMDRWDTVWKKNMTHAEAMKYQATHKTDYDSFKIVKIVKE